MRTIHVIGIGAGDPEQLTLQAVRVMRETQVFFLLDKGEEKADLSDLRLGMLSAHLPDDGSWRVVRSRDPERDRRAQGSAYSPAVDAWRARRADIFERLIREELDEDGTGAFLVWGDPALYDSTLGMLAEVSERGGLAFDCTVVPGISSVSTLAARHRTGLNRVGGAVQVTTGRRLAEGFPEEAEDVVVMLDAHQRFLAYADRADLDIYWGAYLGTPDEVLVSGALREVAPRIVELRARERERKGWIMDTYLLRRRREG
ncbi:precorrin-6A synthase (deacetylating) [Streptomyces sp. NPDC049954]|uniref:precorrin-6A synthase (deacetylating) n=1 Tax=Streptomyces sp. NPDC049954 TaxID=3155779 RepID=UPI0034339687